MLYKLWRALWKEILLLKRDMGGILIIFIMPLVLIITITLIQDSTFKNLEGTKIPLLLVDNDKSEVSKIITDGLKKGDTFDLITNNLDEDKARQAVFNGDYQMAIVIPEKLTENMNQSIDFKVQSIVSSLGVGETDTTTVQRELPQAKEIHLYFDPVTSAGFKSGVKSSVNEMVATIENQKIYAAFQEQLGTEDDISFDQKFIAFKEITPKGDDEALPNSVQHNVPAWALFAIFFIVVPLSINLVKEKNQGTIIRILANHTPYYVHVLGKTFTYLMICMIQFLLMLAVGVYLFPYLDLPKFEVAGKLPELLFVTFFAGLAAIGFGILLGTLTDTQEQSAPLGATSVVILAAIGGIWVPVFMMPDFMQTVSKFSPMNWGLNAYYDIILRNVGISQVLPGVGLLLLFYIVTVLIALIYERKKHSI